MRFFVASIFMVFSLLVIAPCGFEGESFDDLSEEISLGDAETSHGDVIADVLLDDGEEVADEYLYEGYEMWCQGITRPLCGKERTWLVDEKKWEVKQYPECGTDHRGEQLMCSHPHWSDDKHFKICHPPRTLAHVRAWRRARLRYVIGEVIGAREWWVTVDVGFKKSGLSWSEFSKALFARTLYRYFMLVAHRETTMRPDIAHRLPGDVVGARRSYKRQEERGRYEGSDHFDGWRVVAGPGTRDGEFRYDEIVLVDTFDEAKVLKEQIENENPEWIVVTEQNSRRWKSWGYLGQNSAGFLFEVDKMAPPEAMCLETFSVESYLRRMRQTHRYFWQKIDCLDKDGRLYSRRLMKKHGQKRDRVPDTLRPRTWRTLHRSVSGGKTCSGESDTWLETHKGFVKRAETVGMGDPDQEVTKEMLGTDIPPERLLEIVVEMDEIFCKTADEWEGKQATGVCSIIEEKE